MQIFRLVTVQSCTELLDLKSTEINSLRLEQAGDLQGLTGHLIFLCIPSPTIFSFPFLAAAMVLPLPASFSSSSFPSLGSFSLENVWTSCRLGLGPLHAVEASNPAAGESSSIRWHDSGEGWDPFQGCFGLQMLHDKALLYRNKGLEGSAILLWLPSNF